MKFSLRSTACCVIVALGACIGAAPQEDRREESIGVAGASESFDPELAIRDDKSPSLVLEDGERRESGEEKATPREAQFEREQRERQVERAEEVAEDDDEAKAKIARNPPPQKQAPAEGAVGRTVDTLLDGLLVVAASLAISAGILFARSHPRITLTGIGVVIALAVYVATQVR